LLKTKKIGLVVISSIENPHDLEKSALELVKVIARDLEK